MLGLKELQLSSEVKDGILVRENNGVIITMRSSQMEQPVSHLHTFINTEADNNPLHTYSYGKT